MRVDVIIEILFVCGGVMKSCKLTKYGSHEQIRIMDFLRLGLYNPSLEDLYMFGFGPHWPELMTYGKFLWTDLVLTLETTLSFSFVVISFVLFWLEKPGKTKLNCLDHWSTQQGYLLWLVI